MWINHCERAPTGGHSLGEVAGEDSARSASNKWRHYKILVKKQKPSETQVSGSLLFTCSIVLISSLLLIGQLVESKTHHSKRQALTDQTSGAPQQTGRENTNWWNLWWQQYINEAVQPTVSPIVSVSFNGRTINLSPSDQSDLTGANSQTSVNRDLETNFVPQNSGRENQVTDQDIERNEKLRLVASNLPDNTHPFAAKQMMLAQRKSGQQQTNWQSVKPTIIQMSSRTEAARSNRQADMFQTIDMSTGGEMGIQMRNSMNRATNLADRDQMNWPQSVSSTQNMIQVQLPLEESRFEQQQNQMADYSEENEPELDNSSNLSGGMLDSDQGRATNDSSTSSLMMEQKPQTDMRQRGDMVTQQQPGRAQPNQAATVNRQPTVSSTSVNLVAQNQPESETKTGSGRAQQQPTGSGSGSTKQPGSGGVQRASTPSAPRGQQQQVSPSPVRGGTSSATSTNPTKPPEARSSSTLASSSAAPDTSSRPPVEQQTSTVSESTDLSETPISLSGDIEAGSGPVRTSTTPSGRVELENGRPAQVGNRQQASTSSSRPASKSATTPSRGSSFADSNGADRSMEPFSGGQRTQQQSFQTTTMTSAIPSTSAAPTTTTSQPARQQSETTSPVQSNASRTVKPQVVAKTDPTITRRPDPVKVPNNMINLNNTVIGVANNTETETSDDSDSDSDDESSSTDNQSVGMMNVSGGDSDSDSDSGSDSDDTDSEDTTGDGGQDSSFTTIIPAVTTTPSSTSASRATASKQQQMSVTTTQQPSLTTIDIERLPKSSPSPVQAMNMVMRTSSPAQSGGQSTSGQVESSGGFARLKQPANQRESQEAAKMLMMNLAEPGRMDSETITLPMDTLVRMMMGQMKSVQMSSRLPEEERPITSTSTNMEQTTTTTQAPTRSTSANLQGSSEPITQQPDRTQSSIGSSTREQGTDAGQFANGASSTPSNQQPGTSSTKRRLQPPPTTRSPGARQSVAPVNVPAQTNFLPELNSQGGAGSVELPTQSVPKMMIANLDSTVTSSTIDESSPIGASGGREPKIELINLDLMPIQRIMDSQQMRPFMRTNTGGNVVQTTQPVPKERASPMSGANNGNLATANETGPGQTAGPSNMDEFVLEVEPGMRLRPVSMGTKSTGQMASGMAPTNVNQANTVYMIMMDGAPSKTATKKPMSSVSFPSTTLPINQQQQRGQTRAQLQLEPQQNLATTTSDGGKQSKAAGSTLLPPQRTSSNRASTVATTQSQSSTARFTTLAPTTMQQTLVGMSSKGPIRGSSSAGTELQRQQQQQTTPLPGVSMATSSQSRPKTNMMDNAVETDQRENDSVPTMREIEMALDRGQQRQMNAFSEGGSSIGPSSTGGTEQQQTPTTVNPLARTSSQPTTVKPGGVADSTMQTSSATDTSLINQTTTTQSGQQKSATQQRNQNANQDRRSQVPADERTMTSTSLARPESQSGSTAPGEKATTTGVSLVGVGNNQPTSQLDRIQQIPQAGERPSQRPPVSVSGVKSFSSSKIGKLNSGSNLTSSFIPTKLRSDFNKLSRVQQTQRQQQQNDRLTLVEDSRANPNLLEVGAPTTTQSPMMVAQNMAALRQFGGANRMSAIVNQPVPFGRPSMAQATRSGGRIELPTFEYGPSIAVRRPDEPLANGQIPNCTLTGKNFCVLTKDYPMNEVRQAVERSFRSVRIMYEELQTVSDQELHKDDFNATNNQAASGKFACQTQVEMMRPGWAKDEITKEWMLVVNTDVFPQRVRTESCAQPNTPCEFIAPFYDSTCQQRYSLHRMIAIDPHDPSRSPQVAVFKFPAGCVCRVHPIRKTTTLSTQSTTSAPFTIISSSTSKSIRRR